MKIATTMRAKTVAVTPGLSRAGLPVGVEDEDVDMRATLAEETALAKSKMPVHGWTFRRRRGEVLWFGFHLQGLSGAIMLK